MTLTEKQIAVMTCEPMLAGVHRTHEIERAVGFAPQRQLVALTRKGLVVRVPLFGWGLTLPGHALAREIVARREEPACPDCNGSGQVEVGAHRGGGPIAAPCERCRAQERLAWEREQDAAAERREEPSR